MNARRVHEFMREQFPEFDAAGMTWSNVADLDGPRTGAIHALLEEYLGEAEAIVEVHRKLGTALSIGEAAAFIGSHVGEGQIRATNRECSGFIVVGINGAACGWRAR